MAFSLLQFLSAEPGDFVTYNGQSVEVLAVSQSGNPWIELRGIGRISPRDDAALTPARQAGCQHTTPCPGTMFCGDARGH